MMSTTKMLFNFMLILSFIRANSDTLDEMTIFCIVYV